MAEEGSDEKVIFNQAVAFLMRLDDIMKHLNYYRLYKEPEKSYELTNSLFIELSSEMHDKKPDILISHQEYKQKVRQVYNKFQANGMSVIVLYDYLNAWEIEMRKFMQLRGLIMPKRGDPGQALGGQHF